MRLRGKAYEQKLMALSKSTLRLMQEVHHCGREAVEKMHEITSNSELTEEQVVEQLKDLKRQYLKTSDTTR